MPDRQQPTTLDVVGGLYDIVLRREDPQVVAAGRVPLLGAPLGAPSPIEWGSSVRNKDWPEATQTARAISAELGGRLEQFQFLMASPLQWCNELGVASSAGKDFAKYVLGRAVLQGA